MLDQKNEITLKKRQEFEQGFVADSKAESFESKLEQAQDFSNLALIPFEEIVDKSLDNSFKEDLFSCSSTQGKRRTWSILGRLALFSLLALTVVETLLGLVASWNTSPYLFGFYAFITFIVSLWSGRMVWRELRLLRQLKSTKDIQEQGDRLRNSMQQGEATIFTRQLIERLNYDVKMQHAIENYQQLQHSEHNDAESLLLFDEQVIAICDKQAQKIVSRYSMESALLLAASPLAVLDMALILWRNQKMLKDIARCYGIELGYWSRIKLIRAIIHNVIYAGVSEVAMDLGSQVLSMEMAGKFSARLAQGMGAGLLTARLGYQGMALCRPLSFKQSQKPKLSKIHRSLLRELKSFFINSVQTDNINKTNSN